MKPILYSSAETAFDTNGIGVLSDAISCKVQQVLNGQYELTLQYPVSGLHFFQIKRRSVILAKVDPVSALQPFRVYRITKPSNGIVTVYARHVAYDLAGVVVTPFSAENAAAALSGLSANAITECPFTFTTDKSTSAVFSVAVPAEIWKLLGGSAGSVLDTFGGEYEFDCWNVALWNRRGMDRGVSIRYGKNLTSLEQDENCANCYTGVMPFWVDRDTGAVTKLSGNVVWAKGSFDYTKIYPLDLSAEFETTPSEEELEAAARDYMQKQKICEPVVSWKVEFVSLEQTEEYKGMALLERVLLGDTVETVFEQMDISVKARAVSYVYDSILERYDYVTLGSVRANIADTIVEQNKEISTKPNKSEMQAAIELLTGTILGAKGGSVRLLDTNGDGLRDTIYIADHADPALAKQVWRFNYEGWGASSNGYNGPFEMGATLKDGFLANFIKAGVFDGSLIKTGTITSADGKLRINLDNGDLVVYVSEDDGSPWARYTFSRKFGLTGAVYSPGSWGDDYYPTLSISPGSAERPVPSMNSGAGGDMFIGPAGLGYTLTISYAGNPVHVASDDITLGTTNTQSKIRLIGDTAVDNFTADAINPGKKVLYTGSVGVGYVCVVPDTANYDLFAIKLGTSSGDCPSVVLAYKHGNTIYGVGGWCGTETEYKELYFVSITFSGDIWTLVDAGVHDVTIGGNISAGTRLQLKEVIGVI